MILKDIFTNVTCIDNCLSIHKMLFLYTNIIYFLPIILFGRNKITTVVFLVGIISFLFHMEQCKDSTSILSKILLSFDVISGLFGFFYIIFQKQIKIPTFWYFLLFISLCLLFFANNKRSKHVYFILHSLWHVTTGFFFLFMTYLFLPE